MESPGRSFKVYGGELGDQGAGGSQKQEQARVTADGQEQGGGGEEEGAEEAGLSLIHI